MSLIFLAFANDAENPLPSLSREEDGVFEILSRRYVEKHFDLQRESHATLPKLTQYLVRFREELSVFMFSGHAGRDRLVLEDEHANSEGIAQLLGKCPKLQLVILNGCSTEDQVQRLLELENRPMVIATSAPVGDRTACQFAISFFQAFSDQYAPLAEAFDIGLAGAQAAAPGPITVKTDRDIAFLEKRTTDKPLWGIFPTEATDEKQYWLLPIGQEVNEEREAAHPNDFLINELMDALEPFADEVKQIKAEEQKRSTDLIFGGTTVSLKPRKQKVIIQSFPSPISSHLKALFAPRRPGMRGEVFYDVFNLPRMQRLIQAFLSAVELPAFLLLGQLWDELLVNRKTPVAESLKAQIKHYLLADAQTRRTAIQFDLIPALQQWLVAHELAPAFPGLNDQRANFMPTGAYYNACRTLESILKRLEKRQFRGSDDPQVAPTCLVAEKCLAEILKVLSFLAHYSLISIRNIDVLRNRKYLEALYVHKVVRLEINLDYQDAAPTLDVEGLKEFLHNYSILIRPKTLDVGSAYGQRDYFMNLTPFIFDENAFIQKTQARKGNLKLYYFDHYDQRQDTLYFKHVDNFANPLLPLSAKDNTPLQHLRQQMDEFAQLLFNENLREL